MKTASDPRHQKRISLVRELFASSFASQKPGKKILHISSHFSTIDALIARAAPEWPVDKISKIDLAILRLAVFELVIEKKEPPKVIIDEAVELAKGFGNQNSSQFVNGVLGTILKERPIK